MGGAVPPRPRPPRRRVAESLTPPRREAELQADVIDLATRYGWDWHHEGDSRRSRAGWPDLTLLRERIVYAECKRDFDGRLSPEQEQRIAQIRAAGGEVYVWWLPRDLPEVARVLARRIAPARRELPAEDAAA